MSKYGSRDETELNDVNITGWFKSNIYKIFKPYGDMMIETRRDGVASWYLLVIENNYKNITREEFKLELALRKTSIWKAVNG